MNKEQQLIIIQKTQSMNDKIHILQCRIFQKFTHPSPRANTKTYVRAIPKLKNILKKFGHVSAVFNKCPTRVRAVPVSNTYTTTLETCPCFLGQEQRWGYVVGVQISLLETELNDQFVLVWFDFQSIWFDYNLKK